MTMRIRKLIGTVALIVFVTLYVVAAITVGDIRIATAHWSVQILYFFVAGLVWVVPAALIIRWMQRPDPD